MATGSFESPSVRLTRQSLPYTAPIGALTVVSALRPFGADRNGVRVLGGALCYCAIASTTSSWADCGVNSGKGDLVARNSRETSLDP